MLFKSIAIFIISCNVLFINSVVGNVVDVNTSSGLVRGQTINAFGKDLNQFLGIPFAQPPVGRLRFAKPRALQKPIEGIIDATYPKNSCMQPLYATQLNLTLSEDCLTLNIWSPNILNTNSSKLKPVMFWIYGGTFKQGTIFLFGSNPYPNLNFNGSLLANQDVVFVSANYRLGPFGNLYGGTEDSPGNLNFYDQLLAIKWVRDNIKSFGGDKNQITLFGQSAGSISVSGHILSPLSRGLFRRAIMESGSQFHNKRIGFVNTTFALKSAKQMATDFGCNEDNKWLECLRGIDANQINLYNFNSYNSGIPFLPVDGTEFLPLFAQDAFKMNLYNKGIDLLAGVVQNDGSFISALTYLQDMSFFTMDDFKSLISFVNDNVAHGMDEKSVAEFYLKNVDTHNSTAVRRAFVDFFGDVFYNCPAYFFSKLFAKNTPNRRTYFYELTYSNSDCGKQIQGVCHGDDTPFVFGLPIFQNSSSKVDIQFSREVIKMWTNFAKTGNPGGNWPLLSGQGSSRVKNLNPYDSNAILIDPFKKTCDQFWKNYFI